MMNLIFPTTIQSAEGARSAETLPCQGHTNKNLGLEEAALKSVISEP